ncbi:hypothetical protein ACX1N5_00765 [Acinetobacter sp. ANC 4636]
MGTDMDFSEDQSRQEKHNKAEEYLKQQKEHLASIKTGAFDLNGYEIKNIYARGEEYVIYDCKDAQVNQIIKVYLETKVDEDTTIIKALNSVKFEFDKLKTVLYKSGDNPLHKQRAASAIVIALQEPDKADSVNMLLRSIASEIAEEYANKLWGRLAYLAGALLVAIFASFYAIYAYLHRTLPLFADNHSFLLLAYCSGFASMGGFFSVSLKSKSIFIMQATSKWMYAGYGLERNAIAVIAGAVCFALLSSEIIFANIKDGNTGIFFTMSICFLSGFSEKFIPNALSTLSNDE